MSAQQKAPEHSLAARRDFVDNMLRHTARVLRLNGNNPGAAGSGFFYSNENRLFLLSVLHNFKGDGWLVETALAVNDRPLMLQIPSVNWVIRRTLDQTLQPIPAGEDGLAWAEFDLKSLGAKFKADMRLAGKSPSVNAYTGPLDAVPQHGTSYGFAAAPGREFHGLINTWMVEPLYELDMIYEGEDARGFYRFRLARNHRGDSFYIGSSGAPIADLSGTIVALVVGGSEPEGIIYGVPTCLYEKALSMNFN